MLNDPLRIILVDDHKLVRESWKLFLETDTGLQVVADCGNTEAAIELSRKFSPDVMLVDINMSPVSGFALTEEVTRLLPEIKVIGLSVSNQPKFASRMIELGAKGFLTKTSSLEEIQHGIRQVCAGDVYICDEIRTQMVDG